ncbi:MAG: methyl-accepting chemotaxis protein [Candidatus Omnitrophica bacterium]|nr:methyl-accepting chemotaxis protein [Candidatus Omnitrophota bacterium]
MNFLNNISIRYRLNGLIGLFLLFFGIIGVVSFNSVSQLSHAVEELSKVDMVAVRNVTLMDMYHDGIRGIIYMGLHDPAGEAAGELKSMLEDMDNTSKELALIDLSPEIKKAIKDVTPDLAAYLDSSRAIMDMIVSGKRDEAINYLPKFQQMFSKLEETLGALGELIEKTGLRDTEKYSRVSIQAKSIVLTLVGLSIILGIMGLFVGMAMVNSLSRLVVAFKNVSEGDGDLTKRIPIESKDEIAALAGAFNKFTSSVEVIIGQVKLAASQLNSATDEISGSSQKISDGAQQQAASFEELSGSVQSNATNASGANDMAQNVASNAKETGKGMDDTMDAMSSIEKSSKKINEAVEIITDIADQTNLLALNAAIEAARAGEHGKGFAVVADEVRKLAERSADSARDIKNLIGESSIQVQRGVSLSHAAGDALKKMVVDVTKVAEQLKSISTATQEQAATMEQNTSITESNAASSEELAAAAEQMSAQAQELQKLVGRFRINEQRALSATAVAPKQSLSASDKPSSAVEQQAEQPKKTSATETANATNESKSPLKEKAAKKEKTEEEKLRIG